MQKFRSIQTLRTLIVMLPMISFFPANAQQQLTETQLLEKGYNCYHFEDDWDCAAEYLSDAMDTNLYNGFTPERKYEIDGWALDAHVGVVARAFEDMNNDMNSDNIENWKRLVLRAREIRTRSLLHRRHAASPMLIKHELWLAYFDDEEATVRALLKETVSLKGNVIRQSDRRHRISEEARADTEAFARYLLEEKF